MEITACKVRISGRVTGVGFRYFTLRQASRYPEITGYVRNINYGEVEVLLQGKTNEVEEMTACLRRGPFTARVDNVEILPVPFNPSLREFEVE